MDLEEGRICEFNMHLNSNYYNDSESMLHNSRHSDVKTYNYSSDRICIAVLTDDRQKYKIWMDWINYLDREVMYANTHYLTGETSDFFRNYKLPKVVKSVKPSDSAKFEVEEIRFQVDETGALWDILTKSIYTNEFDYVINAFLFEHGRITKCIIKKVWDSMEDQVVYDDIFSIDEMNGIEYEIVEREEEIRSEKYYEEMSKNTFHEDYEEYKDLYDILILKNNNFYEIYGIDIETMGNIDEYNVDTGGSKFLECIVTVPEDYNGEKFNFKKSKLWQDGILLNFNPQYITPMGFCYVKANFTTEARFELNASRHELNNNREVINKWNKKIGNIIQKKVAENCISVLRENNIDFEINNLLAQDEEDPFAKENVLLMRKVLNELLYENTCNLPCTNK